MGGSAESRYLCMDKLKTRSVLCAYKNVSCAEGVVYNKGTVLTHLFNLHKLPDPIARLSNL